MEKQKPWQLFVILAVIGLTLINILPTIFFYMNPLKSPIDETKAMKTAERIAYRVNSLEQESIDWLHSFTKLIGVEPESIKSVPNNPRLISVTFNNPSSAARLRQFLDPAAKHIPFIPKQMSLFQEPVSLNPNRVLVRRNVGTTLDKGEHTPFSFVKKRDQETITDAWKEMVFDRAARVAFSFAGPSQEALLSQEAINHEGLSEELVLEIAQRITQTNQAFPEKSPLKERYFQSFSFLDESEPEAFIQKLKDVFTKKSETLSLTKEKLLKEQKERQKEGLLTDGDIENQIALLAAEAKTFKDASLILKNEKNLFISPKKPLAYETIVSTLNEQKTGEPLQRFEMDGLNPFVQALEIDWNNDLIRLVLYEDLEALLIDEGDSERIALKKEQARRLLFQELQTAKGTSGEEIQPFERAYAIKLTHLINPTSLLSLHLSDVAEEITKQTKEELLPLWMAKSPDLTPDVYPIYSFEDFKNLSELETKLSMVVYAPSMYDEAPMQGFNTDSIYIIARGLIPISRKFEEARESPAAAQFQQDLQNLSNLLSQSGFQGYSGDSPFIDPAFKEDIIFRMNDYAGPLLSATREDFVLKGSKKNAALFFTDFEQRLITLNRIEDRIQEDLVRWEEEYQSGQVSQDPSSRYLVPAPTRSPFWENLKLSTRKYFRGDERKILTWGLDLSGGKTVRIALVDQGGRPVVDPSDLNQAVNELFNRVNAMGVSERTIRIEGNNIVMDFPGSQAFSAAELIKPASMTFHIVNEKFGDMNPNLRGAVNTFLQEVWNEANLNNRLDVDSINEIAFRQLGGDTTLDVITSRRSKAADLLYENGLRLAAPGTEPISHAFNDTLSRVARLEGDSTSDWGGSSHPLLFVFHNYALEGSSLTDVRTGFDQTQGNLLSFSVKRSYEGARTGNPRDDLYAWTSQFAKDRIEGTERENYSRGNGWRMAVILNGRVISSPTLRAALSDGGTISGRFTQREISNLAADLKAGSLSFIPKILSEENVSPDLGREERMHGIMAASLGFFLVVLIMCSYYRFAGVVASVALIFNLLIMWGVLQNIGAVITLPGLAGIVLTIGMAVDANVLVFERIREEFRQSGRIASAIQTGYKKAFSAIIDSNITTMIAALILLQFDSGPIRGFAVTLLIGILSSMFTSLFMTRYFFAGWVKNPKNKELKMSSLIGETKINFLSYVKPAIIVSLIVMAVGGFAFMQERSSLFGMDFTGGYSLSVELAENPEIDSYRQKVSEAFIAAGARQTDFQIRQLNRPNQLRIQFGVGMEDAGRPFAGLKDEVTNGAFTYDWQKNPRIDWIVTSLQEAGLEIPPFELAKLDNQWSVASGQFSDAMRKNAIWALSVAMVSILIYITLRFEFKFAIASIIALAHDVALSLAILATLRYLGLEVQIDLAVIGAIMTIIGYSLNDTIIVFDRIREDMHIHKKWPFEDIINHAVNVTLSRTLLTSFTTFIVLVCLVVLGGASIFTFSLVMAIGVFVGTLSSFFIAGPTLLFFHNKEDKRVLGPSKA